MRHDTRGAWRCCSYPLDVLPRLLNIYRTLVFFCGYHGPQKGQQKPRCTQHHMQHEQRVWASRFVAVVELGTFTSTATYRGRARDCAVVEGRHRHLKKKRFFFFFF